MKERVCSPPSLSFPGSKYYCFRIVALLIYLQLKKVVSGGTAATKCLQIVENIFIIFHKKHTGR